MCWTCQEDLILEKNHQEDITPRSPFLVHGIIALRVTLKGLAKITQQDECSKKVPGAARKPGRS